MCNINPGTPILLAQGHGSGRCCRRVNIFPYQAARLTTAFRNPWSCAASTLCAYTCTAHREESSGHGARAGAPQGWLHAMWLLFAPAAVFAYPVPILVTQDVQNRVLAPSWLHAPTLASPVIATYPLVATYSVSDLRTTWYCCAFFLLLAVTFCRLCTPTCELPSFPNGMY
jgi:hypothetical protein